MSNSATTAAKRRRTGAIMSPIMQNTDYSNPTPTIPSAGPVSRSRTNPSMQKDIAINNNNINRQQLTSNRQLSSTAPSQQEPPAKQLTLTQVINHMDSRILTLENKVTTVANTVSKFPDPELIVENTSMDIPTSSGVSEEVLEQFVKLDEIDAIVQENIATHVQEFDHRYQVLVSELAELKQALMKLQTYTLEINKTLFEERIQILSEMSPSQNKKDIATSNDNDAKEIIETEPAIELTELEHTDNILADDTSNMQETIEETAFDINSIIAQCN